MFDLLMHARPIGVLLLILATIAALRAAADLPTMIWLRPRLVGWTSAWMLMFLWGAATLILALITHHLLAWLGLVLALMIGLPLSREIADFRAYRADEPASGEAAAKALIDTLEDASAPTTSLDADDAWNRAKVEQHQALEAARRRLQVAKLSQELTGKSRWAYRGHVYRHGAAEARVDFMAVAPEEAKPWHGRWRSAGAPLEKQSRT